MARAGHLIVAGVDGCASGWAIVIDRGDRGRELRVTPTFRDVMACTRDCAAIAVDMPIGLLQEAIAGGRECDREARILLGERRPCVFSPPIRPALRATDYREALRLNRGNEGDGPGITVQCFNILPRIREVDELMDPKLQERVREVHPELSFYALNGGRPATSRKRGEDGREERLRLLLAAGIDAAPLLDGHPRSVVMPDDVLDACAACWSAGRLARGEAYRIPEPPPRDVKGLRMEICF